MPARITDVSLPPGRVLAPVAGTMAWGDDGRFLGVWGWTVPLRFRVIEDDGSVRDLTPAEAKLAHRLYGGARR